MSHFNHPSRLLPKRPRPRLSASTLFLTPHGTRVLVTGASCGIGLAYAEALAEAGCDVVLAHRDDSTKAEVERARLARARGRVRYRFAGRRGRRMGCAGMSESHSIHPMAMGPARAPSAEVAWITTLTGWTQLVEAH